MHGSGRTTLGLLDVLGIVLGVTGHGEQRGTLAQVHQPDSLRLPPGLADLARRVRITPPVEVIA